MKRAVCVGAVVGLLSLGLTGCAGGESYSNNPDSTPEPVSTTAVPDSDLNNPPYTFFITLPNGAQVLCAGVQDYKTGTDPGNLNCDWTNAQGLNKPATANR